MKRLSNQKFFHLLITRLNVGYIERCASKGVDPNIWINNRLDLFLNYTLSSILKQSEKSFHWVIFVDFETTISILEKLKYNLKLYPNIELKKYSGSFGDWRKQVKNSVAEIIPEDIEYLISTRIDSDDIVHFDFIKTIQSHFGNQNYLPLNFDKGYLLEASSGIISKKSNFSNPFVSLIEKKSEKGYLTVYHKMHHEYLTDTSLLRIKDGTRLWCMMIHENNDSSSFSGLIMFSDYPEFYKNFGIKQVEVPGLIRKTKFLFYSILKKISSRLMVN